MAFNQTAITATLLAAAANENNLDDALRLIHEAAGIQTSEVAEVFFGEITSWDQMTDLARLKALLNYVKMESLSAEIARKRH